MRLRLLAAAIVLTGSLLAADPGLVSLALPDTQLMAGVNVEQLMLSPFGQYLQAQAGQLSDNGLQKLIDTTGFDPRRDLREILVSSSGMPGNGSGLMLARGTFNVARILEAATADGAIVETYKGVSIIQKSKQESLAFPDSTLAIAGGAADVRAAIDRKTAPTAIGSALAVEVNRMSTTEDAWFVSMAPLSQLQPQSSGANGPGGGQFAGPFAGMNKVQQASGGIKFGANVVVSLQAVSPTEQDAAALAAVLKSFAGVSDLFMHDQYVAAGALLKSLNVTADGPATKISLSVPETQIEQMIQAAHANQPSASIGVDPLALARPTSDAAAAERPAPSNIPAPQRIRVGREVQHGKLVQQPAPVYPPSAQQARISGVVRLNAIIGTDGTVQNLTVASGHPLLVPAALEAVRQWVYAPTLLNGKAVEVATQVEVNFALSQ